MSRRALVASLSAAAGLSLTGCGVRLERDAPQVPGLRTQDPPADQDTLLATLGALQRLVRTAESTDQALSPWVGPLLTMHRSQVSRLVDVMAGLGIDVPSVAGSSSRPPAPAPSTTPSGSGTSPAPPSGAQDTPPPTTTTRSSASTSLAPDVAALARAEQDVPASAGLGAAWSAEPANRAMLLALGVTRHAAVRVLGARPAMAYGSVPAAPSAAPLAQAIRPAVYGFEVIAARTPTDQRALVTSTLGWLYGARSALDAALEDPARPSYRLPVQVTDQASARRLAQTLLGSVARAAASQVTPTAAQGQARRDWLVRVWSLAAADGWQWGTPPEPFPGLTL